MMSAGRYPATEDRNSILGTTKDENAPATGGPFEPEVQQAPDVSSDRSAATDAKPEGGLDRVKKAPLAIKDIENLEDDSKGG